MLTSCNIDFELFMQKQIISSQLGNGVENIAATNDSEFVFATRHFRICLVPSPHWGQPHSLTVDSANHSGSRLHKNITRIINNTSICTNVAWKYVFALHSY